jgi:cobaltochelatase CobT
MSEPGGSPSASSAARRQRLEAICGAAIRALSGDAALQLRGGRLHRGERVLPPFAPHLSPAPEADDLGSFRGAADGLALRVAHSDPALHGRLAPAAARARMVFGLLEQFRVEALAPAVLPGVARNLRHRHEQWSLAFHRSGLTETAQGLLLYTVAQVCRARASAEPVVAETEDLIEATRVALAPRIGAHLGALRRLRHDQAAYATHARAIADAVDAMLRESEAAGADRGSAGHAQARAPFTLWFEAGAADADTFGEAFQGARAAPAAAGGRYRVFTTAYDRELRPASALRPAVLDELRARLDRRIAEQGFPLARLARELQAALARPAIEGWDGAQEHGRIDGRRLAQLVATPAERRLFRLEHEAPGAHCVVSFLVDCSGSMKRHGEAVAVLVDVLARALELAGVPTEVLGFSTGAWNGGRALRDWRRAGCPAQPGRLNEACHLVFKDADTPWRSARRAVAALLRAELFREGIDGEAVDWACERLAARPEPRRLLVVVSDGSPTDAATQLANDEHYLGRHLREVVARREREGNVEIVAVGVGLDLAACFPRHRALDLARGPGRAAMREIVALIARRERR